MNYTEFRDLALEVMEAFFRTPEGRAMIMAEAEKARIELGLSKEEFLRGLGVPV